MFIVDNIVELYRERRRQKWAIADAIAREKLKNRDILEETRKVYNQVANPRKEDFLGEDFGVPGPILAAKRYKELEENPVSPEAVLLYLEYLEKKKRRRFF